MANVLLSIITIIVALGIGFAIGLFWIKVYKKIFDKKILNNAIKVLDGKKSNEFELGDKILKVNKFKVRNEKDEERLIDFNNLPKVITNDR